jgi:hypothetical protein
MELYKTTHATDWRRVRWVHDYDYNPEGLISGGTEAETQEAIDIERTGLDNGSLVALGAIVQTKCPGCEQWQDKDSLWAIVIDADEDLEAWGTENLDIPEKPVDLNSPGQGCSEKPWRSPTLDKVGTVPVRKQIPLSERAQFHLDVARQIPLSAQAQDYVEKARQIPPPPEGPEDDTTKPKRRLPAKVRTCIEAALRRADSKLRRGCGVDPKAQELMRLYLDTWVAGPLRTILDWDDGNDEPFPNWS